MDTKFGEGLLDFNSELEDIIDLFNEYEEIKDSDSLNELLKEYIEFEDELEEVDEAIGSAGPKLKPTPKPGHFYQIKTGDNLFSITSRAYGVKPGRERLKLARLINNNPYNLRFRRPKPIKFFPQGIISFFPEFVCGLAKQSSATGEVPRGKCYAIIKIPSLKTKIDMRKAIRQNRKFSKSLGWKAFRSSIVALLGFTNHIPGEREFAEVVARWQQNKGVLKVDGIISPQTFALMKPALKAGEPLENRDVSQSLDHRTTLASQAMKLMSRNALDYEPVDAAESFRS